MSGTSEYILDDYTLGETDEDIIVDTAEDVRLLSLSLARQARRSIDIFTQDMDAALYNNRDFEQALFQLVRQHNKARVRILCYDSRPAIAHGHSLIRLAQNLTSSVAIHKPAREHQGERSAWLIADRRGLITRSNAVDDSYLATVNFNAAQTAAKLSDSFEEMWQHSTADSQVRRIYM